MKYGTAVFAFAALIACVFCSHYAVSSYFKARHLKAQAETIAVRTRLLKHQVGGLEQKVRVLNRVQHFMDSARKQRLTPEYWSTYEVQIQNGFSFKELSRIVEQCSNSPGLYYKSISFHAAVGQNNIAPGEENASIEPVPIDADSIDGEATDVALALQGTFLVRH